MANYGNLIITNQGLALCAKVQSGILLNFTRMRIGSGLLTGQNPATLLNLITPIAYFTINSISSNANTAHVKGIFDNKLIVSSTYSCELGLFAQDPDVGEILYAYANAGAEGDTIPPFASGPFSWQYQLNPTIGNAANVTATIPSTSYIPVTDKGAAFGVATLDGTTRMPIVQLPINIPIENLGDGSVSEAEFKYINTLSSNVQTQIDTHIADYTLQIPYAVATGTANTYAISIPIVALVAGMAVSVKINIASTGASTLNWDTKGAKSIKKPDGSNMTNLKLGIYTFRYDGTNFITQGEGGGGNAIASHILVGETATVDSGDIVGTMVNNGAVVITPSNVQQTIPAGFHTGAGNVPAVVVPAASVKTGTTIAGTAGTMPVISADTVGGAVASMNGRVYVRPTAAYWNGTNYAYYDDPNFTTANIKAGKSAFGLAGTCITSQFRSIPAAIVANLNSITSYDDNYIYTTNSSNNWVKWNWAGSVIATYSAVNPSTNRRSSFSAYGRMEGVSGTQWYQQLYNEAGTLLASMPNNGTMYYTEDGQGAMTTTRVYANYTGQYNAVWDMAGTILYTAAGLPQIPIMIVYGVMIYWPMSISTTQSRGFVPNSSTALSTTIW